MAAVSLESLGWAAETSASLAPELVERLAATLSETVPAVGEPLPITWHWIFFVPLVPSDELGGDGHPRRVGELAERFPRRMFAGAELRSHGGLRIGEAAVRHSSVRSAEEKSGRSGELLVVSLDHRYTQGGETVLEERQDLVYRPASNAPTPKPGEGAVVPAAAWSRSVRPDRPLLLRYSAVTFNAHRIHYDETYARDEEGYPGLVVHGPLTATLSADLAASGLGRPLQTFRFRAEAPLFEGQELTVLGDPEGDGATLRAVRCDGAVAMSASAS